MSFMLFFPTLEGALIEMDESDIGFDDDGQMATTFDVDDIVSLSGRAKTHPFINDILLFQCTISKDEDPYWIEVYIKEEHSVPSVIPCTGPKQELLTLNTQCTLMGLV